MTAQPHEQGHRRTPREIRASLRDDRSPRAIRAALPIEDRDALDRQYREALRKAGDELDLTPLHECVEIWWRHAVLKADPAGSGGVSCGVQAAPVVRTGKAPDRAWSGACR
jgi:hypothetical protein